LAGVLNGPHEYRDSAYYSIDHASKRESRFDGMIVNTLY